MSNTIQALRVNIQPVHAFTSQANAIAIQSASFGPPPRFFVHVGIYTPGVAEVPAQGVPGHAGYVPAVPAVPETFEVQKSVEVPLTQAQWNEWEAGGNAESDAAYIRQCVLANLGYTAASQ